MDRFISVRRQPPKVEQPGHARSRFPRGTFSPAKLRRRGMREVTGGRFGLLPGLARGSGGFTARSSLSGLGRTEGLGGTPGVVPGLGSCPPGALPTAGPNFTGAGVTIEFLRHKVARSADLRHRVLEGVVAVPLTNGQPTPGRRVIPLAPQRKNNPGRFQVPFGMVFLMVDFETFACDANGEIPGCQIPNFIFNLSRGLNSTVFLNGRGVSGMLAGQHLDHAFEGLGVKIEPDLIASYEVTATGCARVPTTVGVKVKGYLVSRELYSEAFDVICPSGPRGSCT